VLVTTRGGPFADTSTTVVRRRATRMLGHLGFGATELSIALVDDTTIRELNRIYRSKDKPTDVLAFPMDNDGEDGASAELLGDVIVSIPTARRQARARGRPVLAEVTLLLAHGLLHLLGYDHENDAQEREMNARVRELTGLFGS
jgi:probable rRNA maturation factor